MCLPLLILLSTTFPTTTTTPTMSPWKGNVPRVYELTCDETVCPPDSFCLSDYDSGGSRCHCNLGRHGETCSEGERSAAANPFVARMYQWYILEHTDINLILFPSVVQVNFPKFYGYSHITFEPLKNSYQTFQITLEFKVLQHLVAFPCGSSFIHQSC